MEKETYRPKAFKTLALRLIALVLSLWLVFMFCLTWAVAKDFQRQIEEDAREFVAYNIPINYLSFDRTELPGYKDGLHILQLGSPYTIFRAERLFPFVKNQIPNKGYGSDDWFWGKWNLLYGFQPAIIFYNENNTPVIKSGNLLSFTYCGEADWKAAEPEVRGYGYIDKDAMDHGQKEISAALWGWPHAEAPSTFSSCILRMTGWFDGSQFMPVSIDRNFDSFIQEYSPQTMAKRDARGAMEWEHVYDAEAPEGAELVTIYSWETGGYAYDHTPLTAGGVKYDSLVTYLETAMAGDDWYHYRRENLVDCIFILRGNLEDEPEGSFYALAVRCWPLQYALLRMIPAYLVSFGVLGLVLWLILRSIRRNLTNSVEMLLHRLSTDAPIERLSNWKEPAALEICLKEEQQRRRSLVNENQQLKASLDYARDAEENRRKLVSNITHELKTPLAIIHTYAEGLQSGIAEEKREKYLDTILTEAERMDAMVLEMLDFSRLESGKVKLSADYFSLKALTEGVVEKLAPLAKLRNLNVCWGFYNDCFLTADESRMLQVVTNLVTNALRYAPEGGTVWVRVFSDEKEATFQIENEGTHMEPAVLEKLFDSFYRADDARTEKGTGLGLPIARSIIQLHRGTIRAENTWDNGKECICFVFTVPLT